MCNFHFVTLQQYSFKLVHCDRGYASQDLATKFTQLGTYYNINMPWNRCGIPRNAMVDAEREIDPKKTDCKWMYTSLHKGRQEIVVWDDGQPVNFLSDYYTSKHTGTLKRSTKGAKAVYFAQVPSALIMPLGHSTFLVAVAVTVPTSSERTWPPQTVRF